MPRAIWTPTAEGELADIAYWIAVKDGRPPIAERIVEEIRDKAEEYASMPEIGQRHPDLPKEWLYFRHKRWIIVYLPRADGLDVLRVIDSSRDFTRIFGES